MKQKVVIRLENAMVGGDLIDFKHYKYNMLKNRTIYIVWGAHNSKYVAVLSFIFLKPVLKVM